MRVFIGALVVAVALGGAVWLGGYQETKPVGVPASVNGVTFVPDVKTYREDPSWADPLAVFIAVAGVGAGAAVIVSPLLRRKVAV
jgi:hypothetical protein